ncbi:MAG: HNH endonuclease [Nitrospira sp.]|nr:HNH endonuclease [Nitrospira sp.]
MNLILEKKCPQCKKTIQNTLFVNTAGEFNTKGKYCKYCHVERSLHFLSELLKSEMAQVNILFRKFGVNWDKCCYPCWLQNHLLSERNFCIYCGHKLYYTYYEAKQGYGVAQIHLDHMDPASKGGEDSIRNAVYVCANCNVRKADMPFTDWLKKLSHECMQISYAIYFQKHGFNPEDFIPGEQIIPIRGGGSMVFFEDMIEDLVPFIDEKREPRGTAIDRKALEYYNKIGTDVLHGTELFLKEKYQIP